MVQIIKDNLQFAIKKIHQRLSLENRPEEVIVKEILEAVKTSKDAALLRYTSSIDKVDLETLDVDFLEIEGAHAETSDEVLMSLRLAIKNIADYHVKQLPESWEKPVLKSSKLAWRYTPLRRVGIYVPAGTAPLASSVLMNTVPAKIAGVEEIVMCTPPGKNGKVHPLILAAAKEVGVEEIYKVGGAQAIAAMAYGTDTIKPVDLIVGPGNIYVTLAKKLVTGICKIDKLAGPSDVLILADSKAEPVYIAADMLAQAEHDTLSSAILLTDSEAMVKAVSSELKKQIETLDRKDIAKQALDNCGAIMVCKDIQEMIRVANIIAPEHCELMVDDAERVAEDIVNAGAIFVGDFSPVASGDYLAGPNHVLPTGGTARFDSPLAVTDFLKATSIIHLSQSTLQAYSPDIESLATLEGLDAHAISSAIRLQS